MGCCPEPCPSVESTPPWIPLTLLPVSWTPTLLEQSTTRSPGVSRRSSRITNLFKILLLSWVWTSCPRKTSSRSPEQERSKDSFHSLSRLLKCSPTTPANLFQLTRPSLDSRLSLPASTITCLRSPFTWSATLMRSLPWLRGWQRERRLDCRFLHLEATTSRLPDFSLCETLAYFGVFCQLKTGVCMLLRINEYL